jgi:hypothetical protein
MDKIEINIDEQALKALFEGKRTEYVYHKGPKSGST